MLEGYVKPCHGELSPVGYAVGYSPLLWHLLTFDCVSICPLLRSSNYGNDLADTEELRLSITCRAEGTILYHAGRAAPKLACAVAMEQGEKVQQPTTEQQMESLR